MAATQEPSSQKLLEAIGPFCTSPLGLAPKPHTDTFCLIEDLSYPWGNPLLPSVNAGIDADQFRTAWGTFDKAVKLILHLPPNSMAATFDISAAYRLTPIRPDQQHAVCIMWEGKVYVDRAVMFGLASSAGVFGAVADMLIAIYEKAGFTPIIKWVDDFLVIRLPGQTWSRGEEDFMNLTARAGVPWSQKKLRRFASVQRYIGFDWDSKNKTVALPAEKVTAVMSLLEAWARPGATFSEREAASLHSKLIHCSSIFRLIRLFLRSHLLFCPLLPFKPCQFTPTIKCASRHLLDTIPPVLASTHTALDFTIPCRPRLVGRRKHLFWCQYRAGEILGGRQVGTGFHRRTRSHPLTIGWAEAVAVELALRLALQLGLFTSHSHGSRSFIVRSDNEGVVTVLSKGRSRCKETNRILKHTYLLQAKLNILLHPVHVPSRLNVADALSRGDICSFLLAFPMAQHHCSLPIPDHLLDKLTSL